MKKTICLKCKREFEDINFEKFGGNDLNIRTWCNECVSEFKLNISERRIQQ